MRMAATGLVIATMLLFAVKVALLSSFSPLTVDLLRQLRHVRRDPPRLVRELSDRHHSRADKIVQCKRVAPNRG
jgi:hypothetical protein